MHQRNQTETTNVDMLITVCPCVCVFKLLGPLLSTIKHTSLLLTKIHFIFLFICMSISVCTWVQCPKRPEEGAVSPGAATIGGCELTSVVARN